MSKKPLIIIVIAVILVGVGIAFTLNNEKSPNSTFNATDSPNIVDSSTANSEQPESFVNENGTKTYVINAVDSPVLKP